MEPYSVILVVDRNFGPRLDSLPKGTPAWVVDSPVNRPAIEAHRKKEKEDHLTGLTSFSDVPRLAPSALAASMIDTLEEHHGAFSHSPPFAQLSVIGAASDSALTAAAEEIGFRLVSETADAIVFSRKE